MAVRAYVSPLFHRLTAVLGVALVLLLVGLSVRPDLHQMLCQHPAMAEGHQHTQEDGQPDAGGRADACVISLFAHGQVLAALILIFLFGIRLVRAVAFILADFVVPRAPAFRLPHGCGPPLA